MNTPSRLCCWASLLLAIGLTSCSTFSSKNKLKTSTPKKDPSNQRLSERLGKWDQTRRSSFDKHRSVGGVDKNYKTKDFHRGKDYSGGKKEFNSGKDGFKTREFAQASKESQVANKTFSGADDKSRMADDKFKTTESRFADQENRNADKRFSSEGDVFRTRENPTTKKAMESNHRPYIEQMKKKGYTEDEVKGLLNKQ